MGSASADSDAAFAQTLTSNIAGWTKDIASADAARASEAALAAAGVQVYTDAISAIDQAIQAIKTQNGTITASSLIAKLESVKLPQVTKVVETLSSKASLLQQGPGSLAIVDMLYKLRATFVDQRKQTETDELQKKQAYLLQVQGLKTTIDSAQKQISDKVQSKAKNQQALALATSKLQDVQRTAADTQTVVQDLTTNCQLRARDYASRQETQRKEIAAIDAALQLLTGQAVQNTAAKVATALLNIKTVAVRPEQKKVAAFLHSQAELLKSKTLSAIAAEAAADPFNKVRDMIQALITKLQLEGQQTAQSKADWCNNETAASAQAIATRNTSVAGLATELDALTSGVAKLGLDIAGLQKQQADNQKALAEQVKLRAAEKAQNLATIQDAQAAQTAIAQAIVVLKEFYTAAGSPSFVQVGEQQPTVASGAYTPLISDGKNVIHLLEQIQADYARLGSSTSALESTAQKAVDKSTDDLNTLQKQLDQDIQRLTTDKASRQQAVLDKTRDLDSGKKELSAALAYSEKLKASCVNPAAPDAKQRLDQEIQALQQALRLLGGQ